VLQHSLHADAVGSFIFAVDASVTSSMSLPVLLGRFLQPNGQGALLHPDGSFFEGTWSRGKPQRGHGNIHSPKGWEYEGGILRSMRDGAGECSWPDLGMRYKGEW
jgi:hypothetical protein